jgi:UDPglucose--hexose-1-phosphate uridylyltransferase
VTAPTPISRTSARLADGREVIFFDRGGKQDVRRDARNLAPRGTPPELRYDPLLDVWVSHASGRNERTYLPSSSECPLCPSRGGPTEIPSENYDVVVFENRFPSFVGDPQAGLGDWFRFQSAAGRCEVVCFTPDHNGSFATLGEEAIRLVIEAWADRTAALSRISGVQQVFIFENKGEATGVTLDHPHGQIYGYPFVSPRTRTHLERTRHHRATTGRNLYEDVVRQERAAGDRVVIDSDSWICFVPFAARYPIEVHLYPHQRVPDFPALTTRQRDGLAAVLVDLFRRLDAFYGFGLPYVAAWHQAPVTHHREDFALHLELFSVQRDTDRIKYLAGSEAAMDAFVNDRSPEAVAARLRRGSP